MLVFFYSSFTLVRYLLLSGFPSPLPPSGPPPPFNAAAPAGGAQPNFGAAPPAPGAPGGFPGVEAGYAAAAFTGGVYAYNPYAYIVGSTPHSANMTPV